MTSPFDLDHTGTRMSLSQPTSPPPAQPVFSRPGTGPRPTPAPQVSGATMGAGGSSIPAQGVPTNDEIEAKIQAAMSSAAARSPTNPPRDTRTQLFVGNLPYRVRWQDLKDLFRRSGTVLRADVSLGPDNRSRGYGTVMLATAEDAGRAMDMFNGYVWQTRTLEVRPDRMGLAGGVGMGTASAGMVPGGGGEGVGGFSVAGFNTSPSGSVGIGLPPDAYGVGTLAGASGLTGLGGTATGTSSTSGGSTPFIGSRLGSTSPFLNGDDPAGLTAQLARVASPSGVAAASVGVSLNSPLLASAGGNGIHINSPRSVHTQLTGVNAGGERSRNLFVGNLPFHIQWQDLKDLFRQAGTILRADVALGPDGRSRGFGTVSFATETDAERAVRMFNGYDFNGRQLKVHFDKFAAPSATAVPYAGMSMSAPQSPHSNSFAAAHPSSSHAASFAQQILLQQQHQRLDHQRQEQHRQDLLNPLVSLQRANTDIIYKFPLPPDDISRPNHFAFEGVPNPLTRARSDSVPQLLHTQSPLAQTALPPRHSDTQVDMATNTLQPQAPLHISLPPYQSPYQYDFSPGSPYGYDFYRMGNIPSDLSQAGRGDPSNIGLHGEPVQPGDIAETLTEVGSPHSTQGPIPVQAFSAVNSEFLRDRPPLAQPSSNSGSDQQGSQPSSTQNSQPATQATSPAATSPTSAASGSLHAHPAHPGPIALPPPVMTFTMPPSLSPAYHPQMSPYASPLNHPGMMMGVGMTPYGLPPITPSMPSFQFVPQPSPGPAPSGGSTDLLSPSGAAQGGMTPGGNMDPQGQASGSYLSHLRQPHGPMLSPYTPFSPGVTMSPGAFWGRPGTGAANPYINPAPGAPVHPAGYFPPVTMEEPQGYFPPFLPSSGSNTMPRPAGSSLANVIMHDSESASGSGSGSESAENTASTPQSGEVLNAAAAAAVAAGAESQKLERRPGSTASEGTTAGTGVHTGTEPSPRPPSSNATSWQTDSGKPSPSDTTELEKHMQALAVDEGIPDVQNGAPQAETMQVLASAGKGVPTPLMAPVMTRAESDPVPSNASVDGKSSVEEIVRRPSVGGNGRTVSDSVAA